ncbi:hypothetical protein AOQ84DRAFT_28125 [Glonium stellatum]|uniref:Uncharacterized protein n=1 Tax=Glonium stellatum TaxID=574774 RepID=A0A8E2F298_9PEZI|nr:hypothetical protein AOQ84DRAFT_28125 [Glonium stellatum]
MHDSCISTSAWLLGQGLALILAAHPSIMFRSPSGPAFPTLTHPTHAETRLGPPRAVEGAGRHDLKRTPRHHTDLVLPLSQSHAVNHPFFDRPHPLPRSQTKQSPKEKNNRML